MLHLWQGSLILMALQDGLVCVDIDDLWPQVLSPIQGKMDWFNLIGS